jgi:chromosome segregation ATPase
MSLQTYDPSEHGEVRYTYESLSQCLEALTKQLSRAQATADALEGETDFRRFVRLSKTQEDNRGKVEAFTRAFAELRRGEPGSRLDAHIASALDAARRALEGLERQIGPIRTHQEEVEAQRRAAAEEAARLLAEQRAACREQEEAEQMDADADFLKAQLGDIADQATIVNDATHQVDDVVDDGHAVLAQAAGKLDDAHELMVDGNKDLAGGEKEQKASSKVIWIIFAVVTSIVVVVGLILGLKFGGVF